MQAGRELDALVAEKVFGEAFRPYALVLTSFPAQSLPETPFYSTDIAAAWKVVEHLKTQGWQARVGDKYCLFAKDWSGNWNEKPMMTAEAVAETAPHAICLAALKAMGVEV